MIEARHFVQYTDIYPFVRLQANGQLVLRQLLRVSLNRFSSGVLK